MKKKRAKASNCKFFKSCGNVFGGCKNPKVLGACLHEFTDQCSESEKRYKTILTPKSINN
jgi:hypothetical protein